jgi:hypothetical protein
MHVSDRSDSGRNEPVSGPPPVPFLHWVRFAETETFDKH